MRQILLYIIALTALAGCFKELSYNTTLVLRPTQQLESGGDAVELEGVVAYAFAADTTYFTVESYEMALSGIMVDKESGEQITAIATSTPYENDIYGFQNSIALKIDQDIEYVAIVVIDTLNEDYGYTTYELNVNLPTTYIAANFAPWKEGGFTYGIWYFVVNDPYDNTPQVPEVELPESDEESEPETEVEPETETDPETETEPETEVEPETETDPETETEPETEPETEETDTETDTETAE